MNDSIFHAYARDGVMSRDKLLELAETTDCFLSLDRSGPDCYGRSTLDRAMKLANDLRSRGLSCWIMETHMELTEIGSIVDRKNKELLATCNGIDKARAVLMFMTKGYIDRVCAWTQQICAKLSSIMP